MEIIVNPKVMHTCNSCKSMLDPKLEEYACPDTRKMKARAYNKVYKSLSNKQ